MELDMSYITLKHNFGACKICLNAELYLEDREMCVYICIVTVNVKNLKKLLSCYNGEKHKRYR